VTVSNVLRALELEQDRHVRAREAKAVVDDASRRYSNARGRLRYLERRTQRAAAHQPSEGQLQSARDEVHASRVALQKARRALIAAI
jgi:hypothetical protein